MITMSNLVISVADRGVMDPITGKLYIRDKEVIIMNSIKRLLEILWPSGEKTRYTYTIEHCHSSLWQWNVEASRHINGTVHGYLVAYGRLEITVMAKSRSPYISVDVVFGDRADQFEWGGFRPKSEDTGKQIRLTIRDGDVPEWMLLE